jgi:RES domain.
MRICACCFNDIELKQFVSTHPKKETVDCSYCGFNSESIEIEELLDFFSDFFSILTKNEKGKTLSELIQQDWNLFSTDTNIQEILTIILQQLNSDLTVNDKVLYIKEITDCIEHWETLKEDLKWNRRFLADAERLINLKWDTLFGIYSTIDSNNEFYRARIHFDGCREQIGKEHLGCPPKEKSVGGRANPQGIPYLYLCNNIDTTLYETRVSYLDVVSIGTFKLKETEELKIVDFTQWQSPFNAFCDDSISMIDFVKGKLLRQHISKDLSKPMRRFDSEMEYLPTQFICEFVRYIVGATGIQFNSSLHKGGVNIVLFEPENVQCVEERVYQVNGIEITYEKIFADA